MTSRHYIVFLLTLVGTLVSSSRRIFVFATERSVVFVAKQQQVPTSGVTVVQTVTSLSEISCGDVCQQTTQQLCNGFVFEKQQCDVDSSEKSGTCDLLSFTSLSEISFGPSHSICQRFFARLPLLSSAENQTKISEQKSQATTTIQLQTRTTMVVTTTGTKTCSGPLRPTLMTTSGTGSLPVYAMVLYNDQLYVVRQPSANIRTNAIEVYNSSSLQLLSYISISGYDGIPSGLAIDPTTNNLYVNDNSKNKLYKVNLATLASSSLTSLPADSLSLSVNSAHNILVTYSTSSKIEEYTSSGTLVRTILPGNNVWHALEVSNGTLAISRIGTARYDVSLMSYSGQVSSSYNSTSARSLEFDNQGYILVAVETSNSILALNPTLSSACNVTLPINPSSPKTLWLDESRNRLYVGEGAGQNRILVFKDFTSIRDVF